MHETYTLAFLYSGPEVIWQLALARVYANALHRATCGIAVLTLFRVLVHGAAERQNRCAVSLLMDASSPLQPSSAVFHRFLKISVFIIMKIYCGEKIQFMENNETRHFWTTVDKRYPIKQTKRNNFTVQQRHGPKLEKASKQRFRKLLDVTRWHTHGPRPTAI